MLNSFPLVLYQVPVSTGKRIGTSPLLEYLRTVGLKLRYVLGMYAAKIDYGQWIVSYVQSVQYWNTSYFVYPTSKTT
jgi:hypothetical protein